MLPVGYLGCPRCWSHVTHSAMAASERSRPRALLFVLENRSGTHERPVGPACRGNTAGREFASGRADLGRPVRGIHARRAHVEVLTLSCIFRGISGVPLVEGEMDGRLNVYGVGLNY